MILMNATISPENTDCLMGLQAADGAPLLQCYVKLEMATGTDEEIEAPINPYRATKNSSNDLILEDVTGNVVKVPGVGSDVIPAGEEKIVMGRWVGEEFFFVGVGSLETFLKAQSVLGVVSPSDRLKEAMKRLYEIEQGLLSESNFVGARAVREILDTLATL